MSKLTLRDWKHECSNIVKDILGIEDLLDDDDVYDVLDTMEESYEEGITPEDWVREAFAEDLVGMDYDEELAARSLEESELEDDEGAVFDDDEDTEEDDVSDEEDA